MAKKRSKIPQVILSFLSSIKASRDKLQGILKFERLYGPWQIHLYEGRPGEQWLNDLKSWGATGIIVEADQQPWVEKLVMQTLDSGIHVVLVDPHDNFVDSNHPFSRFCRINANGAAIGRMGAEYYVNRGVRHFAFVDDVQDSNWSRFRKESFAGYVKKAGYHCHVYPELNENQKKDWGVEQRFMIEWLNTLPKPVGIMAAMDARGRQILDACMMAGIDVPFEVQVLGVDNDEMICETASTPMSSILANAEKGGFLAAHLLHSLIERKVRKKNVLSYDPMQVISRRSTEAVLFQDRIVVAAIEFIRINSGIGINVGDVSRHLGISQRLLQIHFKASLGRSVIDEIMRVRFNRICALLSESDISISEITGLCGFENESYLGRIFKKRIGKTMTQFRREHSF